MRYAYPVTLTPEPGGGFSVSFPDVPEALTQGEDEADALAMAEDALVSGLSFYVDREAPLPVPSEAAGRPVVAVPVLEATKLALHEAMLAARISTVELARRMGIDEKNARRVRDILHRSRVDQVELALRALGRRVVVEVEAA
ncbi:type II toxin-antitoxin system HicB family antitoxin [Falsiroseomonas sp. CW058]|uniref:type II toxin-antitoxin system HicB family antitoxin n=1 Tax=Falsiroseomonas sp. CW058 TaxID=3388664 RepID=UPI003D3154B9